MFPLVGFGSRRKKILCKSPLIWSIHYPFNPNPYLHTAREYTFLCRPWCIVYAPHPNWKLLFCCFWCLWVGFKSDFFNPQESPLKEEKWSCYNSKIYSCLVGRRVSPSLNCEEKKMYNKWKKLLWRLTPSRLRGEPAFYFEELHKYFWKPFTTAQSWDFIS